MISALGLLMFLFCMRDYVYFYAGKTLRAGYRETQFICKNSAALWNRCSGRVMTLPYGGV